MLDVCGDSPIGIRDIAIILTLYGCGLRRSEIVNLNMDDYNNGDLRILGGKRNKDRKVPVPLETRQALGNWFEVRDNDPGPIFTRIRKSGQITQDRLTTQAILYILQKRAKEAQINHLSPHDMRRSYVGNLLDLGVDLPTVQALVGHSDPKTTSRYDRRPEEKRRKVIENYHIPSPSIR